MRSGPGNAHRRQAGFSTVEILVGMTILIIVVTIVAGYFKVNVKAAKKSDTFFVTTQLASSYLEKTKRDLTNPDTLKALLEKVGTGEYVRTIKETVHGKPYDVQMKYRRVSPTGKLIKIRATVIWNGSRTNSLGTAFPFGP